MDCDKCNINLNAYLDGELEGAAFAEVEHHVAHCESYKAELDRLVKMRGLLKELRDVEVPEGEREVFIDALRERLASEGVPDFTKRRDLRPALVIAIAAVLVLIVLVAVPAKEKTPSFKPTPGLSPVENVLVDGIIATALDDHFLATSGDFLSDPSVSQGEILAVWKVIRASHSELFEPIEPVE